MSDELPGTPPIVQRSRSIIQRKNRIYWLGAMAGVLTAVATGYFGMTFIDEVFLMVAMFSWVPVTGIISTFGPDSHTVADAEQIVAAWASRREEWAKEVVDASLEGADAEVEAWSAADAELKKMARSAAKSAQTQ